MYKEREIKGKIKEFSLYYKIGSVKIENYYFDLIKYPFYVPDYDGMYCLEQVCQTRVYAAHELKNKNVKKEFKHTVEYAINDAIYNVYKEKAIPYLSEEYVNYKGIEREEVKELKLTNM